MGHLGSGSSDETMCLVLILHRAYMFLKGCSLLVMLMIGLYRTNQSKICVEVGLFEGLCAHEII